MARIVEIVTGPMEGASFVLEDGTTLSIGRSSQNDITLIHDPWVSSTHATFKCKGDVVYVMDLHSSNGSYVRGRKIAPNSFVALKEYLIIGSTLCRISTGSDTLSRRPISVKKSAARKFLLNPLAREALRIARERRATNLSVIHLFMAAIKTDEPELTRFLRSLKLDPDKLFSRLDKLQVFQGSRTWINDFLAYQYKSKEQVEAYITPLVQDYLERFSGDNTFDTIDFVKQILREPYNILHPMLGIRGKEGDESMPGFTEKVTLNPYDAEDGQIILPKTFWTTFKEALDDGCPIFLTGSQGSGKSSILKQCFHALPKVDVAHFHSSDKSIFDPEVFLTFSETSDLAPYVNRIIKTLRKEELVAIDHFSFLLELLEKHHLETTPLMNMIRRRSSPTILSLRAEHLDEVAKNMRHFHSLDLDHYLGKVSIDILKSFMLEFESDVKYQISESAGRFLEQEMLQHFNLAALKAFFEFCAARVRGIAVHYKNANFGETSKERQLSKAFFQSMYDHWASPFRNHQSRHPSLTTNSDHFAMPEDPQKAKDNRQLAEDLESLLQQFMDTYLRQDLTYQSGEHHLRDMNDDQKGEAITELLVLTETMLLSFVNGFKTWLETFLSEIDPKQAPWTDFEDPALRWSEFVTWYEDLDQDFVRGHFLQATRRSLRRSLRELESSQ